MLLYSICPISFYYLAFSSRNLSFAKSSAVSSSLFAMAMTNSFANSEDDSSRTKALSRLSEYHPIVIEGMGYYDPRDPQKVADSIVSSLQRRHVELPPKQLLVVTQGDPLASKGISAITPLVANRLSRRERGLVCLDESIADYHSRDADRTNVVVEVRYSQLLELLQDTNPTLPQTLETAVDAHIANQNAGRYQANKPPVKEYFKTFAMLQEVTKAGLRELCGGLTICHTSNTINPWSVTSFYQVGLELGLYQASDIVAYDEKEILDFATLDPR